MTLSIVPRALALMCILSFAACTKVPTVTEIAFDADLPTVAAQYRTEVREHGKTVSTTDWRLWREDNRVEREDVRQRTGEIWQRDGATLFHSQIYHGDKRGIEYQPGDLDLIGASAQWAQQALIVSPELLQKLAVVSERHRDGVTYRRYKGQYADAQWDITLRLDVMLPQSIERKHDKRIERIQLHEVHPLAQAPWQPTPSRDYGMIDFADLGDHERDPFVIRLQASSHADVAHQH